MPVLGADISHWEDNPTTPQLINFIKMKAAGAYFVIFKATQGIYIRDNVFVSSWANASVLLRGAYHFLDWTASADKQAAHFAGTIANHILDLPPIVDFECRLNVPSKTVTISELWNFVTYLETHTGRVPMIYTSPSYWREYGSTSAMWSRYPLWIAHYGVAKPTIPFPWLTHHIWQYTATGDGIAYGCEAKELDLNYYNGSIADLYHFVGQTTPPTQSTDQEKLTKLWASHPELH